MPAPPTVPASAHGTRVMSRRPITLPSQASGSALPGPSSDSANEVVCWAVFCCVLVPAVLLVHGTVLGEAALTTVGLAAMTFACRLLLHQSERAAARSAAGPPAHRRTPRPRARAGVHRGGRRPRRSTPVS